MAFSHAVGGTEINGLFHRGAACQEPSRKKLSNPHILKRKILNEFGTKFRRNRYNKNREGKSSPKPGGLFHSPRKPLRKNDL
jgi:hypothetical protein